MSAGGRSSFVRRLKSVLLPSGPGPRRILFGDFAGIRMEIDLHHRSQLVLGLAEREVHRWLVAASTDARSAIDAGAAEGVYSLYFLLKTPVRQVFAFEPSDLERALLARNLELNGLAGDDRLRIYPNFVGDASHSFALDSLLPQLEMPCCVKVDVEGAEADVLRGAPGLLRRRDVRWLVEVHSSELEAECRRLLMEAGLEVQVLRRAWWRRFLPELRPIGINHWLAAQSAMLSPANAGV